MRNANNLRGVWTSMKHELLQMRRQGPGASFVLGVALPVDGGFTAH